MLPLSKGLVFTLLAAMLVLAKLCAREGRFRHVIFSRYSPAAAIAAMAASCTWASYGSTARAMLMRGGGSGVPAIVPGKSGDSLLIRYVAGLDAKTVMPPAGPRLTPEQIELLRNWIDQGAVWPEKEMTSRLHEKPAGEHWAFQTESAGGASAGERQKLGAQPYRRFRSRETRSARMAALARGGAIPAAPSISPGSDGSSTVDRRAGRSCFSNATPEALDRIVDDLLARETYGERWARHWLDLVRYAETNGYERDAIKASCLALSRLRDPLVQ